MPRYGPWLTAPPQTILLTSADLTWLAFHSTGVSDGTFDGTRNGAQLGTAGGSLVESSQHGTAGNFSVVQDILSIDWGSIRGSITPYADFAHVPANSNGVPNYESDSISWPTNIDWVTSVTVDMTYSDTTTDPTPYPLTAVADAVGVYEIDPATFTYIVFPDEPDQRDGWSTGTQLAAMSRRANVPAASPSTAVSPILTRADMSTPGAVDAAWSVFVVAMHSQVAGGAPALDAGRRLARSGFTATLTYQPPRYRWTLIGVPPLRQYPRDDSLGSAPRQGTTNGPTSTQGSARQGWRATYR